VSSVHTAGEKMQFSLMANDFPIGADGFQVSFLAVLYDYYFD
jgi:hypothetical protein